MTELLIVFVVSNGVQLMDIAGPADVFAEANTLYGKPLYRSVIVAERKDIRSSCGFRLRADLLLGDISTRCVDTMLVAGAPDAATRPCDPVLTGWLRQEAPAPVVLAQSVEESFRWRKPVCWMDRPSPRTGLM